VRGLTGSWRRHLSAVHDDVALTWGSRLGGEAQDAMQEVVVAAQLTLWAAITWFVAIVVVVVTWQLGPAFVVVILAGWVALGVCTRRRMRAWRRLNAQVRSDLGLTGPSNPAAALDFRHGPARFDESVEHARRFEHLDLGAAAEVPGGGPTARWERRLAGFWGDRYDAAAVHAQRVRVQWIGAQALAVLVAIVVCPALALYGAERSGAVLAAALVLFAVASYFGSSARRRTQRAAARHLGIPVELSRRLPTKPDVVAFDAAVAELRRELAAGAAGTVGDSPRPSGSPT
jgi:FtsH-binding integral membrane protein